MNLDLFRTLAASAAAKSELVRAYWELLSLVSRDTGASLHDLHEANRVIWGGKRFIELDAEDMRAGCAILVVILLDMEVDVQGLIGKLGLWR